MRIAVYGTLKRGYGNNRILTEGGAEFVSETTVQGVKLYNAGFPVAKYASINDYSLVEVWDIGDVRSDDVAMRTLQRLDRLEGEGSMYIRERVATLGYGVVDMYIGAQGFWNFNVMEEVPRNNDGIYVWTREAN
jgi:gamma-glutamylcyclotransferase (GGCT)/AIG2-like uncharacterized protein YtfP